MKYLKKYKLFESVNEDIHDLCKKYGIRNYIDIKMDIDLKEVIKNYEIIN